MLTFSTEATQKWRLHELDWIVDELEDDLFRSIDEKGIKIAENYQNIVAYTAGKSIRIIREIICLCAFGFPDGSFSLARNLYEQFIVLCFFKINKADSVFSNYVHDYFVDYELKQYRILQYERELLSIDKIESDGFDAEIDKLNKRKINKKTKGDFWWSGYATFAKLADFVLSKCEKDEEYFIKLMQVKYKVACISLHSGCLGNTFRLGSPRSFAGIDTSAILEGHDIPLEFATAAFILVVAEACDEFGIDYDKYKTRLCELLEFYKSFYSSEVENV